MRTEQTHIARNPCSPAVSGTVLSYNSLNQLSGVTPPGGSSPSPSPLTYDAAGNVVFDNGPGNTYLYDGEGRVCAVASSGPTGGALLTGYIYDADGRRVAKGTIQRWGSCDPASNGFQPMTDYILGPGPGGSSGAQLTEMAMDENGQMAWKHTNVWAGGKLLATYDHDGLHYHLTDWLGTRRVQTDAGGAIEDACASLPYGDALSCIGPTFTTEHHFTGKERDTESGNDYFGARYYASSMGRFMSPDEVFADQHPGNPQSWNLYSYARNNPLRNVDPNGRGVLEAFASAAANWIANGIVRDGGAKPFAQNASIGLLKGAGRLGLSVGLGLANQAGVPIPAMATTHKVQSALIATSPSNLTQAQTAPVGSALAGALITGGIGAAEGAFAGGAEAGLGSAVSTGTRYVGAGEAVLIEETGMVPNTNAAGALKQVYYSPEDPMVGASATDIQNAYQLPSTPTHTVTLDTTGITNSYGGNVEDGTGIEMITNQPIPATSVTPIKPK